MDGAQKVQFARRRARVQDQPLQEETGTALSPYPVAGGSSVAASSLPNIGVLPPGLGPYQPLNVVQNSKVKDKERIDLPRYPAAGAEFEAWKDAVVDIVAAASANQEYTRAWVQECFRIGTPQDAMFETGANQHLDAVLRVALELHCIPKDMAHPVRAQIYS